jgi:gliding motility-associated protein GldE
LDTSFLFYAFSFIILLILSAFFSSSEVAFFSLTENTVKTLKKSKKQNEKRVADLLSDSRKLLITIITGNTAVNVAIASIAALITNDAINDYNLNRYIVLFINIVIVTFVILIVSEIIPKVIAVKDARKIAIKSSLILKFFHFLLYPATYVLDGLTVALSGKYAKGHNKYLLSEKELRTLVDVGEEKGALKKDEKEMIHSIFELGETIVREIMVPRTDMVCIEEDATLTQILNLVKEKLHSRIPVYKEKVDNITGILYLKDLLPFIRKRNKSEIDIDKLVHTPYFVPEQKKINELLREFQKEKIHMAIVVDEYGGTAGIVTLEDIIEEIVGEIQDEYDQETPLYTKIDNNTWSISGSMQIDELYEELNIELPDEEGIETLAGFLLGQFGNVPKQKEKIIWKNLEFVIEKVSKRRIQQVRVRRLEEKVSGGSK